MKDDQKKKDLKEKNDDFKKDFFERLTKQLKSQKMTFKQLAEDMGRDPRFFEIKMRPTGSIPSLQEVKEICSILKVDINYFMNSDGDVRPAQKRVDYVIPSDSKSILFIQPVIEECIDNCLRTSDALHIEMYMYGNMKGRLLYERCRVFGFILDRLLEKRSESIPQIVVNLYCPKMILTEDLLDKKNTVSNIPWSALNTEISLLIDEIRTDFGILKKNFISLYGVPKLPELSFTVNQVQDFKEGDGFRTAQLSNQDYDSEKFGNLDCAIIINETGIFTFLENYVITKNSHTDRDVCEFRTAFGFKPYGEKAPRGTLKEEKEIRDILRKWDGTTESAGKIIGLLKENGKVGTYVKPFVIVGLPAVGKSTVNSKFCELFFDGMKIESSDEYINYRAFHDPVEDNGGKVPQDESDTRESFKKYPGSQPFYLDVRNYATLIAITKATAKKLRLLDLGGKEIFYDSTLLALLQNGFTIINLAYASRPNESIEELRDDYLKLYIENKNLADKKSRSNIYRASLNEAGESDVNSESFRNFIYDLFDLRYRGYMNRSHFTVYRDEKEKEHPESIVLKILCRLFSV